MISKIENGAELLTDSDMLHVITSKLIDMLKDYYDSVRDQACALLEYLITHFIRRSPVESSDRENLLSML